MQSINHQMMGYDRAITMFSPDGRLLQVEYAKKTVKQGSTAIGMVCKDGVVLVTDKRIIDPLIVADSVEKIFDVDEHIAATAAGIISDARVLIDRAQVRAQQHRVTYDAPVDVIEVVKDICSLKQICTQSGGLRPFGVSLLIAGIDSKGPSLYETDPTGIFFQYLACAIGEFETEVDEVLHKEYNENLNVEAGIKICIKALLRTGDENFGVERLDVGVIMKDDKKFRKVGKDALNNYLKDAKANAKKK